MSQSRLAAVAVLGLSTLTAAGIAYHQYQRAEALTLALAEAAASKATEARPRTPREAGAIAASTTPEVETTSTIEEEISEESEDRRPNNDRGRFDRANFGSRMQALMADPAYAQAFQTQQRARLDGPYAELFAKLNLPPDALNQLQNLLIEKQNAARDVFMAAREEGLGGRENREQLREVLQLTQDEIDAQIRETIGEQNYAALKNYEETGPQRALVDQLESRLSYSATPLNSAQAEALTAILAETTTATGSGRSSPRGFGGGGNSVDITDEAVTRAQGVLSADQIESLVALQEEQAAARQISEIMRREARAARNPDTATAPPAGGGG